MSKQIKDFFEKRNIEYFGILPIEECRIIKPHLLPENTASVVVFLAPYFVEHQKMANISLYAASLDYHLYFEDLKREFEDFFACNYPQDKCFCFCDHSPIDEVSAAAKCGLGVVGKNRLLINEKYKSFVFIGEILCTAKLPCQNAQQIQSCTECNKCVESCDFLAKKSIHCLSSLTQTKKLSPEQTQLLKKHNLIWGCDNCQLVCPLCQNPAQTPIAFFRQNRLCNLDKQTLLSMSDKEFNSRAFSWRGKEVLLRNLDILHE